MPNHCASPFSRLMRRSRAIHECLVNAWRSRFIHEA
ncbi:hypothetical protein DO73_4989 [Burkholderia pseudomallei]|nr:hypothetical protein DO73_4989 [Burkholderia pseudomallei]